MEVVLVGTPTCQICKKLSSQVSTYCNIINIPYTYYELSEAPEHVFNAIVDAHVTQAPAVLLFKEGKAVNVLSGESAYMELRAIMEG